MKFKPKFLLPAFGGALLLGLVPAVGMAAGGPSASSWPLMINVKSVPTDPGTGNPADGILIQGSQTCVPIDGPGSYAAGDQVKAGQKINLMWTADKCTRNVRISNFNNDYTISADNGGRTNYWVEITDSGPGRPNG